MRRYDVYDDVIYMHEEMLKTPAEIACAIGIHETQVSVILTEHYAARRARKAALELALLPRTKITTITKEAGSLKDAA